MPTKSKFAFSLGKIADILAGTAQIIGGAVIMLDGQTTGGIALILSGVAGITGKGQLRRKVRALRSELEQQKQKSDERNV